MSKKWRKKVLNSTSEAERMSLLLLREIEEHNKTKKKLEMTERNFAQYVYEAEYASISEGDPDANYVH